MQRTPFSCKLCTLRGDVYGNSTGPDKKKDWDGNYVCMSCERGFRVRSGGAVEVLPVTWDSEEID